MAGHEGTPSKKEYTQAVAARYRRLRDLRAPKGGEPLFDREVAEGVEAKTGVSVSLPTIARLRNGTRIPRDLQVLEAIATFFGVSVQYLLDEDTAARADQQYRELGELAKQEVQGVAVVPGREGQPVNPDTYKLAEDIGRLPPEDQQVVAMMIKSLAQARNANTTEGSAESA